MPDHVFIDHPDARVEVGPAESDPRFVQHVSCDGAYFHVLHWDCHGAKCSEPRCIINKGRPDCTVGEEGLMNTFEYCAWRLSYWFDHGGMSYAEIDEAVTRGELTPGMKAPSPKHRITYTVFGQCDSLADVPAGAVIKTVDGQPVLATCEGCGAPIVDDDTFTAMEDGVYLCGECAEQT